MWIRFGLQLDQLTSSVGRGHVSQPEGSGFDPGLVHNLFLSVKVVGALVGLLLFFLLNQTRKVSLVFCVKMAVGVHRITVRRGAPRSLCFRLYISTSPHIK